jgi:uncharacterized membrane protein YbhN (UPF0104 family)
MLKRVLNRHWKAIQYCFVGLVFLFIAIALVTNWKELSSFNWELNYLWFTGSLVLVSVSMLSLAVWWTLSIRLLHEPLGWGRGTRIWSLSQLAKYLPGGVWNYVSRAYASDKAGVSKRHTVLSLVIETVLRILAALIVFLASLPLWPRSEWSLIELLLVLGVLLLGLLVLNPSILNRGINLALRIIKRPPVDLRSLKYGHVFGLLAGHILTVVGAGIAFYLLVASVHSVSIDTAIPMAGMLAISVIVGFLNPLTPHGLGTREALLIVLLSYYLPLPAAIVVSVLARLWLTISELATVLVVTLVFRASSHADGWSQEAFS